jgi:probable selenium-dependent hydroxylase accessory protein YqeC
MWHYRKIDPHQFIRDAKYVTFVGGGGKTSLAEAIARIAVNSGQRVLITTTTKIWAREPYLTLDREEWHGSPTGPLLRVGRTIESGKLTALSPNDVERIGADFDLVLIEADGAKGLPLKYPAHFEPVIPAFSDRIIVVAGLDGLCGTINERVFRWQLFVDAAGVSGDSLVTPEIFARLLEKDAMFKGVDVRKASIFLNKFDVCTRRSDAVKIAVQISIRHLLSGPVVVSSVRHGLFYGVGRT